MDVLFLISVFRLYPGLKTTFEHNSVCKSLFLSACFYWDTSLCLCGMDQKYKFGGLIGWLWKFLFGLFISLLQSIQTKRNITRCCWNSSITYWQRTWLLLHDWTRTKFMFAWSRDWTALLTLRKNLSTLHFQHCRFLKEYVLHCTRYRAN